MDPRSVRLELVRDAEHLAVTQAMREAQVSLWIATANVKDIHLEAPVGTRARARGRYQSILESARQRGVTFRATGNEPSWLMEILEDRVVFRPGIDGEQVVTPSPVVSADAATGERVYQGTDGARRLSVRISPGGCVDTMSGQRFEHAVVVQLGDRSYGGCGVTLSGAP